MVVTSGNAPVSISYELKLTREYMNWRQIYIALNIKKYM